MSVQLYPYQIDALKKMKNGCILNGGVGSGKSITGISYYYIQNGGSIESVQNGTELVKMKEPMDLYIITTARKRDTFEWEAELKPFGLSNSIAENQYNNEVVIDSWNNIKNYTDVENAFFIFDEDRVTGNGVWVKSFLKIVKSNLWVILSATPGDTWSDYIPVFVANGFYRHRSEFNYKHVIYNPKVQFPQVLRYINTGKLIRYRNDILIDMDYKRNTIPHHMWIGTEYDVDLYNWVVKNRKNPFAKSGYIPCEPGIFGSVQVGIDILTEFVFPIMEGWNYTPKKGDWVKYESEPIESPGGLCYALRRISNSHQDRINTVVRIATENPKVIIFYNFDYELDILRSAPYVEGTVIAEWNGHKHQQLPRESERWVYLVQYTSGSEGWNCTETDTIIFYSQNYSYKVMTQAAGRIDRLNTKFTDLYYYHLISKSNIDKTIRKTLNEKKTFNESDYYRRLKKPEN